MGILYIYTIVWIHTYHVAHAGAETRQIDKDEDGDPEETGLVVLDIQGRADGALGTTATTALGRRGVVTLRE